MKVDVVVIDRLGPEDRKRVRTELRRDGFSCHEVDGWLMAVTRQVDRVRNIADATAIAGVPRCRLAAVDGKEVIESHDAPGQYKQPMRIAAFNAGLEDAHRRYRFMAVLKHAGFDSLWKDGILRVGHLPERREELEALARRFAEMNHGSLATQMVM